MKLIAYRLGQDDPKMCTSIRLARRGYLKLISSSRFIPRKAIVLNPEASETLSTSDAELAERYGLVVIDASWKTGRDVFSRMKRGVQRKLPTYVAANPTNYGKLYELSSAEAVAAALQQRDLADAQNEVRALRSRPSIYTQPRGRPAGRDAVAPA